ncbi:MAG TPA: PspC domain-containing protein [Candidatus Dormibacteraeota bacterium]|nr:PspC domain-containing protein [Candidatus Dormibacteraeota bacterium]
MQSPAETRFYRGSDRIAGGVCSGLAAGLHVDPLWIRLAFVVLAFVQGIGVLLYVVLWFVMPEHPENVANRRGGFDAFAADVGRMVGRAWAWLNGTGAGATSTSSPNASPATAPVASTDVALWVGGGLVVIGAVLLASNSGLVRPDVLWPVLVIAVGGFLLVRSGRWWR